MAQIQKLRLNKDFKRLYYSGRFLAHPLLICYLKKNRCPVNRIGITTSKKVGNAVQRNRARRIILAAYRQLAPELPQGYDVVFVARDGTPRTKSTELLPIMRRQLTKLMTHPEQGRKSR